MADAKPKKTEPAKKIVDVKSDGDGATGTSRPVIVTNRAILKDPMMAEVSQLTGGLEAEPKAPTIAELATKANQAGGAPELSPQAKRSIKVADASTETTPTNDNDDQKAVPPSKKKIIIKPTSADAAEALATTSPKSKAKKEPTIADLAKPDPLPGLDIAPEDIEVTPVEDDDEETPAQSGKVETQSKPESATDTEVEGPASAAQPGRSFDEAKAASKATPEESGIDHFDLDEKGKTKKKVTKSGELTAEQQKAFESEEYFLPITTAETKRMRREIVFATLFVTVLIVVWLDIMLDAGLLNVGGIKAVTNFF